MAVAGLGYRSWLRQFSAGGSGIVRVWGLGFGVWGLGFRVWDLGFRIQGPGFRGIQDLGFRA